MRIFQVTVSAAFAVTIYYAIVKRRGGDSSSSIYFLGYGIIIPASLWIPIVLIRSFCIFIISLMIGISAIVVLMPFFCMEAMHDTAVMGVETNLRSYVTYYCTIVPLKRDPQTGERIPAEKVYLAKKLRSVLIKMVVIVLLLIILDPADYVPFQDVPTPEDSAWPWLVTFSISIFIGHIWPITLLLPFSWASVLMSATSNLD
jgi:hypothetical protein